MRTRGVLKESIPRRASRFASKTIPDAQTKNQKPKNRAPSTKSLHRAWTDKDKELRFEGFTVAIKGKVRKVEATIYKQSSLGPKASGGIFPASPNRIYRKGTVFGEYGGVIITKTEAELRRIKVSFFLFLV